MPNDRTPQMRAISRNTCPNAQPRELGEFSSCDMYAMTVWGYCSECWDQARVPARWAAQVDAHIAAGQRP
jgi:hypothetical protein